MSVTFQDPIYIIRETTTVINKKPGIRIYFKRGKTDIDQIKFYCLNELISKFPLRS